MLEELRKFALKKPEATLSKQKVLIVNRLLTDLKTLLADEPNSKYLDLLTDDDLPQYSDVVLILSQYEAAMKSFSTRYHKWTGHKNVGSGALAGRWVSIKLLQEFLGVAGHQI